MKSESHNSIYSVELLSYETLALIAFCVMLFFLSSYFDVSVLRTCHCIDIDIDFVSNLVNLNFVLLLFDEDLACYFNS